MKNRNYILITGIILVLLASCVRELPLEVSSNGTPLPEGQYPLEIARITLGVEGGGAHPWGSSSARITENMDDTGSVFDAGDKFAVQIYGEEGIYIVQNDDSVKAETPLYWSDPDEHPVSAWYKSCLPAGRLGHGRLPDTRHADLCPPTGQGARHAHRRCARRSAESPALYLHTVYL